MVSTSHSAPPRAVTPPSTGASSGYDEAVLGPRAGSRPSTSTAPTVQASRRTSRCGTPTPSRWPSLSGPMASASVRTSTPVGVREGRLQDQRAVEVAPGARPRRRPGGPASGRPRRRAAGRTPTGCRTAGSSASRPSRRGHQGAGVPVGQQGVVGDGGAGHRVCRFSHAVHHSMLPGASPQVHHPVRVTSRGPTRRPPRSAAPQRPPSHRVRRPAGRKSRWRLEPGLRESARCAHPDRSAPASGGLAVGPGARLAGEVLRSAARPRRPDVPAPRGPHATRRDRAGLTAAQPARSRERTETGALCRAIS